MGLEIGWWRGGGAEGGRLGWRGGGQGRALGRRGGGGGLGCGGGVGRRVLL